MSNSLLHSDELVSSYSTWLLLQKLYKPEHAELERRQRDMHTTAAPGYSRSLCPSHFSHCIIDPSTISQLHWRKVTTVSFLFLVTGFNNKLLPGVGVDFLETK